MGRVVVVNFVSIDGVVQSPVSVDEDPSGGFTDGGWVLPYSDDNVDDFMRRATVDAAALLLGRRSYEILAAAWSQADDSEAAVAAMNRLTKHVVSRTMGEDDLVWGNSRLLRTDLSTGVHALTQETRGEIVVLGSGELVHALAEHDLVDEYRLLLFPVVIGAGKRMFGDRGSLRRFRLTDSTTFPSGVVVLTWTREQDPPLSSWAG